MSVSVRSNAFDSLRWFFALSLLCFHFSAAAGISPFWPITGRPIISAFFILSGFFTYQSYHARPQISYFYRRRMWRILPTYMVWILLTVILGSLLTTLGLRAYWLHPETWYYWWSNVTMLNFLAPQLPGVFTHQPLSPVNASLWTLKVEVCFYLLMPLIYAMLRRYRALVVLSLIFLLSILHNVVLTKLYAYTGQAVYLLLSRQIVGQLSLFVSGMLCYHYLPIILRHRYTILIVSALLLCLLQIIAPHLIFDFPLVFALCLVSIAYTLPCCMRRRLPDYTYGLFLVHFPVFQSLIQWCDLEKLQNSPLYALSVFALSLLIIFSLVILLQKVIAYVLSKWRHAPG